MQVSASHARALPLLPPPSPRTRVRPNIPHLMRSSQWQYSGGLDAYAYPSPPMTTSPTSPKRLQFLDERQHQHQQQQQQQLQHLQHPQQQHPQQSHQHSQQQQQYLQHHRAVSHSTEYVHGTSSAPGLDPSRPPFMATQVLPSPTGHGPPGYASPYPPTSPGYVEHATHQQSRSRAPSVPAFSPTYQSSAYASSSVMSMPYSPTHYGHPGAVHGPLSMAHVPGRIPRTGSRRPKPHVTRACVNCKKAHLSCDNQRPCGRCVTTRKESSCIDVEHKKRGRPRIQPERGHVAERTQTGATRGPPAIIPPAHHQPAVDALGLLRTHPVTSLDRRGSLPAITTTSHSYALDPRLTGPQSAGFDVTSFRMAEERSRGRLNEPAPYFAFANLELRILKTNDALQAMFADVGDVRGMELEQLVDSRSHESLYRVRTRLREERNSREPNRLPGIFPEQEEQRAAQILGGDDIARITHGLGYDEVVTVGLRLRPDRTEQYECRIRLAKHNVFLVVIELRATVAESSRSSLHDGMPPPPTEYLLPRSPMGPSSARGQPFGSQLTSHLQTAPLITSPLREHMYSSSSYFPRQPGPVSPRSSVTGQQSSSNRMQPPPAPISSGFPGLHRSHSTRETRRPEALSNVQLPPIINSAPTTPVGSTFPESQFTFGPQSLPQTRTSPQVPPGASSTRRSSASDDTDEESQRKRRRLNIGEIIDK